MEEAKRTALSAAGAMAGAGIVALSEANAALSATTGSHLPGFGVVAIAEMALLAPIALGVSLAFSVAHVFFEPGVPRTLAERASQLQKLPVLARTRLAASAPLGIVFAFAWVVAVANLARGQLSAGAPLAAGFSLAVASMAALLLALGGALAVLPVARRTLASAASRSPRVLDPLTTASAALVLSGAVLSVGIVVGDTGGDGAFPLGVFGVLKRRELDLRPVLHLVAIGVGAAAPILVVRVQRGTAHAAAAVFFTVVPLLFTVLEARGMNVRTDVARLIERQAPLGKIALAVLRKATDRDHDGAAGYFGGGDCDDRNPRISPSAVDVPGNGIDEDCSGADTPLPPPPPPPPPPPVVPKVESDLNLLLITIDTLRTDVGFLGYPKDVTPNLDRLAERSTVFDRAYSLASYTGKSIGPMLIGKYPNETVRDGGHFNTYAPPNVFVTERLRDAGIFTMGAASHWYFNPWSGLSQGMAVWDLSAKPGEGQGDNDTSVTSKELADAAIRLLSKADNTKKRFFMWVHFFDPHAQYMPHPGAPDFRGDAKGGTAIAKASYDTEVWFTDKHVGRLLDHISAQPWGERTAIIVTADHGEAFADHGMSFHGIELWESLVRVPLLVHVPNAPAHHVPVKRGHIDVARTILDIMGVRPSDDAPLRGESLLPDVLAKAEEGKAATYVERDVYLDMPAGPYNAMRRALITGPTPGTKLIHFGGKQYQLFDLASDPGELDDLAGDPAHLAPALSAFQSLRSTLSEIEVKPDSTGP